jgi:carbonic anhydrase
MLTGSVEFAASRFGTPLVVVLGHSRCGAVTVAVDGLLDPPNEETPNLESVVKRIRPAVQKVLSSNACATHDELIAQSIRENVRSSAEALLRKSSLLSGLVRAGRLEIACAEYSLDTGIVEFFE